MVETGIEVMEIGKADVEPGKGGGRVVPERTATAVTPLKAAFGLSMIANVAMLFHVRKINRQRLRKLFG
jgi:hypothetical protein